MQIKHYLCSATPPIINIAGMKRIALSLLILTFSFLITAQSQITGTVEIENLYDDIIEGRYLNIKMTATNHGDEECNGGFSLNLYNDETNITILSTGKKGFSIPPGMTVQWEYEDGLNYYQKYGVRISFIPDGENPILLSDLIFTLSYDKIGTADYYDSQTGLYFTNIDYNTCYVYGFDDHCPNDLTIPETVNNHTVVCIGYKAFDGFSELNSIHLPATVEKIRDDAFKNCSNLKTIEIEEGLRIIGHSSFSACHNLSEISLPEGLTTIRDNAFSGCTIIESIVIPSTIKKFGYQPFLGCSGLKTLILPDADIDYGYSAFYNCKSLEKIYSLNETPIAIHEQIFYNYDYEQSHTDIFTNATLYVPIGTKQLYSSLEGWSSFGERIEEFDPTRVSAIQSNSSWVDIYNLKGQKTDGQSDSPNALKRGLYIIGNKKVFVP